MDNKDNVVYYSDIFCGIGGFRIAISKAAESLGLNHKCVFSSDIDEACAKAYLANFSETPTGDIKLVDENTIPDHDILLAGFPCQSFSIIGNGDGFEEKTQGTLFFDIARILKAKRPRAFVLENVKGIVSHDKGRTMQIIRNTLEEIGYSVDSRILNALDFGLPQKRERIFIVGFLGPWPNYVWPEGNIPMKSLKEILEPEESISKYLWASDYIRNKRHRMHTSKYYPSIWHENKAGNISSYPYSCALRANASHNYLLVNGDRRLTPREMLRLQGFPENYKIVCNYSQTRTQAGNSLPIPVAQSVLSEVIKKIQKLKKKDKLKKGEQRFVRETYI